MNDQDREALEQAQEFAAYIQDLECSDLTKQLAHLTLANFMLALRAAIDEDAEVKRKAALN